ncbi:MAG: hypothetical protein ACYDHE_04955 [Candidatus Acidiferrales bacterium]
MSRIAERALDHARDAKAHGARGVEEKLAGFRIAEEEIRMLAGS